MEINVPHNWTPEAHQLPVLNSKARFKVLVWHRKAHKTTLALNELVRQAFRRVGTYWYVAPFLSQARKIVWDDPEMLGKYIPPFIWDQRNNSELKVPFPNGSILYVVGADKPDSLRGPNPFGVVLDEYGDMKKEVWSGIIQPIMTANPLSWTWFTGTPKGRNDFYAKYQYAKQNPGQWEAWMLKASESGIISKEALEDARHTTPQAYFQQEYECDFIDDATSFFRRVRENLYDATPEIHPDHQYQLGIDLAKYQDWTVITPFDLNTFKVLPQDRFNQVDWNLQKARMQVSWHKHNKALAVIDATGVGDPVVEDLIATGMSVNPFKFTESTKKELLSHLSILLEQDRIKIPNDEGLIEELSSIRYELTDKGKTRIATVDGMHDDRVMSLALAVWGHLTPVPVGKRQVYERVSPESKYDGTMVIDPDHAAPFSIERLSRM